MYNLLLIGAGGYAKSVLDSVDPYNYNMTGFIDEFNKEKTHLGYPIIASSLNEIKNAEENVYFIAIGNNAKRKIWYNRLVERNLSIINVVDRTALISPQAKIGVGCFVGKMAIINSKAEVGNDCIINTKALIEHGCRVGNHANLSTNSVINGDVIIGDGSFVGSSSVTIGQLTVGSWSTIGAGAVVTKSVGSNVTAVGVPARVIKEGVMLG